MARQAIADPPAWQPRAMPASPLRILSIIPPMTQLNTPYPSTAYLTGFLRSRRFEAQQADLSLALALKLLSAKGLDDIYGQLSSMPPERFAATTHFFAEHFAAY